MAYESLIKEAKAYLTSDNSEFEEYYKKAVLELQNSYDQSAKQLEKQYAKEKNDAAARSMLEKRNMDQYLAARGLSRSGESVQEQLNANISLNNTLNGLADTNARQLTELAKAKNADLSALEEKRLQRKESNDKWATEQAFNIAKAENAKTEREEDIAREAQLLAEERAYQDSVRQQSYAQQMAMLEAEQAFKQRQAVEEREYQTMKIASQREYEEMVRAAERELEAQIRAEKERYETEKAAKDQEYKLEYYRVQQADKERLLAEEREYEKMLKENEREYTEAQKQSDREYSEAQKKADREYSEAQKLSDRAYAEEQKEKDRKYEEERKAAEAAEKERLLAEERAYKEELSKRENALKIEQEKREQQAKTDYYKLQQDDKERLIAEERAYKDAKEKEAEEKKENENAASENEEVSIVAKLSSNEQTYVKNMAKSIVSTATNGGTTIKNATEKIAAYDILRELQKKGTPQTYMRAIEESLTASGYSTPTDNEIHEAAILERLDEVYEKAYSDTVNLLKEQNMSESVAKPYAYENGINAQLSYLYSHCTDMEAYYNMCNKLHIDPGKAYRYVQEHK